MCVCAQVRDAAEKRRLDETQLQSLATGSPNSITLQPDLVYDYNSDIVFEDVYQAVVYGIEEQLAGDVREAVLNFWHTTVEPFFGRGQKQYQPLHTKTEMQQLEAEEHAGNIAWIQLRMLLLTTHQRAVRNILQVEWQQ